MKQALMIYYQKFAKLGLKQMSTLKCCSIGATTLSIMTLSIMTFSVNGLYVTPRINGAQHNNAIHYAECRALFIVMLSLVKLKSCFAESRYATSKHSSLLCPFVIYKENKTL